jgi:hypothetical protein
MFKVARWLGAFALIAAPLGACGGTTELGNCPDVHSTPVLAAGGGSRELALSCVFPQPALRWHDISYRRFCQRVHPSWVGPRFATGEGQNFPLEALRLRTVPRTTAFVVKRGATETCGSAAFHGRWVAVSKDQRPPFRLLKRLRRPLR